MRRLAGFTVGGLLVLSALLLMISALVGLSGCGAPKNQVSVVVPCGQIGPFSGIEKLWRKQYPDLELKWEMGNMVTLTEDVLAGRKKPDVFLSMGDLEVDRLQKAGLVLQGTRTQYAENALAVTVPAENPAGLARFADLAKPAVKSIALPDPKTNSVGKHAVEALRAAGIYSQVEGRLAQTAYAADGKEMSDKGQVDATMAYLPCVTEVHVKGQPPAKPKGLKILLVPQDLYTPFSCEGVVVKTADHPENGKKLLALLRSPEAEKLFREWNFRRDLGK